MKRALLAILLTATLGVAANPALAKDRHDNHRFKHHNTVVVQHHYSPGYNHGNYRHPGYSSSRHHYASHNSRFQHYGHRNYHDHHRDYVGDYFKVLGGTLLISELLYHGHNH